MFTSVYKETPAPIIDIHVYVRSKWLLIDLLHRVYGGATFTRDFRKEGIKKSIFKYCGRGGYTVNNFRTIIIETAGHLRLWLFADSCKAPQLL